MKKHANILNKNHKKNFIIIPSRLHFLLIVISLIGTAIFSSFNAEAGVGIAFHVKSAKEKFVSTPIGHEYTFEVVYTLYSADKQGLLPDSKVSSFCSYQGCALVLRDHDLIAYSKSMCEGSNLESCKRISGVKNLSTTQDLLNFLQSALPQSGTIEFKAWEPVGVPYTGDICMDVGISNGIYEGSNIVGILDSNVCNHYIPPKPTIVGCAITEPVSNIAYGNLYDNEINGATAESDIHIYCDGDADVRLALSNNGKLDLNGGVNATLTVPTVVHINKNMQTLTKVKSILSTSGKPATGTHSGSLVLTASWD